MGRGNRQCKSVKECTMTYEHNSAISGHEENNEFARSSCKLGQVKQCALSRGTSLKFLCFINKHRLEDLTNCLLQSVIDLSLHRFWGHEFQPKLEQIYYSQRAFRDKQPTYSHKNAIIILCLINLQVDNNFGNVTVHETPPLETRKRR